MNNYSLKSSFDERDANPIDKRWAWIEIDKSVIRNNFITIKESLNPGTKVLAVVKADAYGHGSVECAKIYQSCGANYFGVATVQEGITLREGGITKPILILSQPPISSIPLLLEHEIMPSVFDSEFAIQYGEIADIKGSEAPYHLAINTGMNRIGVEWNEAAEFAKMVSFHRALRLEGTFTHFATADEIDTLDFDKQVSRFVQAINSMKAEGIDPGIVHCANSASVLKYSNEHFDMVRPGIILYGLRPSKETPLSLDLKPAMSIKARITDVRNVPIGEGVSYGLRYRSRGYAKICTLPIGYADGLHRCLSGKVNVIWNGKIHPQVGSICMDQCMFEVSQRTLSTSINNEPFQGDVVTIIGQDGDVACTLDEMADVAETINYELACAFGAMRLERIYV